MTTWQTLRNQPQLLSRYLVREQVYDTIRRFFKSRNFHEVFTPTLVPVPGCEPNLKVFQTRLVTATGQSSPAFLITSPEYAIKKLLAAGLDNVFEITRSYRNHEDVSVSHNPEFTILEWYRVNSDYMQVADDFQNLFIDIIGSTVLTYQGSTYDLTPPWPKISVAQAFEQYSHITIEQLLNEPQFISAAASKGYSVTPASTYDELFSQIFFNEIEPVLKASLKPAIVYDYPLSQASLSRRKPADPRFAERFEVFLAGLELGNCFSELTDWQEQLSRLEADVALRKQLGKTAYPVDYQLIEALKSGLPPISGIAVGVDRLVMLAANAPDIASTLFFPASELFDLV